MELAASDYGNRESTETISLELSQRRFTIN